jgi:type II restriction enzyme
MTTPSSKELQQLREITSRLTATQLMLLIQMASALQRQIEVEFDSDSDIATDIFREHFGNRLLIHHAVTEEKLKKKTFEYAFRDSAKAAGRQAEITASDVFSGADLIVDRVKYSMKTEAQKNIRKNRITISKFMEARWIRDKNAEELSREANERIRRHLANYERILILRSFTLDASQIRYDLVEIPHAILMLATQLHSRNIILSTRGNGGGNAVIRLNGSEVFTLRLDGSVEKVTISGLWVDFCQIHASWFIPTIISSVDSDEEE